MPVVRPRQTARENGATRRGRVAVVQVPRIGGATQDLGVGQRIFPGRSGQIQKTLTVPRRGRVTHAYKTPLFRGAFTSAMVWTSTYATPKTGIHSATLLFFPFTWQSIITNHTPPAVTSPPNPSATFYITMTPTSYPTPTIGSDGKPVQPWGPN